YALADLDDLRAIAGREAPVESLAVVVPAWDQVQVEVRDRLKRGGAVGLQYVEAVRLHGLAQRQRHLLRRRDGRAQIVLVRVPDRRRVGPRDDQAVAGVQRVDVHEHQRPIILVDLHGRNLTVADLAEHAVGGAHTGSVQRWVSGRVPYWMPTIVS